MQRSRKLMIGLLMMLAASLLGGGQPLWAKSSSLPVGARSSSSLPYEQPQACPGTWSNVASPNGSRQAPVSLKGVTTVAANDAWAVGSYQPEGQLYGSRTLIERWNGTAWSLVSSPNRGGQGNNELSGVDAVTASDVWAVGSYQNITNATTLSLIERWNGTSWNLVTSPNVTDALETKLTGVAAVTANNVWAVGYAGADGIGYQTLITRWNGSSWSVIPSPNPGSLYNQLFGITVVSANDIWAVGSYSDDFLSYNTLVMRWNGSVWSTVTSPNPPGHSGSRLRSVSAVSANDIWAVGSYLTAELYSQTLIEHWNGTTWQIVTAPSPGFDDTLSGVVAVAANNVWAVGGYADENFIYRTMTMRWNGTSWSLVANPAPPSSSGSFASLNAVAALNANDIWAVGEFSDDNGSQGLALHWTGSSWSLLSTPPLPATAPSQLNGVAARTANDVWAVGSYYASLVDSSKSTLVERWNGSSWNVISSTNRPNVANELNGVAIASANDVWAVGASVGETQTQTLIERWNGTSWQTVASPSPDRRSVLRSVAVVAPNDVWAVGSQWNNPTARRTLIERWNGSSWSVIPSPNQSTNDELFSVTVVGPNDIWAVGTYNDGGYYYGSLILHWNGTAWSVVPTPNNASSFLFGVAAVSANDVWAVGTYGEPQEPPQTLVLRWNGTAWATVPSPNSSPLFNQLSGLTVVAANDVWAVGHIVDESSGQGETLIERWNGSSWSVVSSPDEGGSLLLGVAAVNANDIWAVGNGSSESGDSRTLTQHYVATCPLATATRTVAATATRTTTRTATRTATAPATSTLAPTTTRTATVVATSTVQPTSVSTATVVAATSTAQPTSVSSATAPPATATAASTAQPTDTAQPTNPASATAVNSPTATMVATATTAISPTPCTLSFTDVATGNIFYGDIQFLACRGVISGFPNGDGTFRFEPNSSTTRGQFAKIATLGFGLSAFTPTSPTFNDVAPGNVFYQYVEAAANANVVNGLNTAQCAALGTPGRCFGPNVQISRVQVAVIVQRARSFAVVTPTTPTFADVPAGSFGYAEVETLANRQIITGAGCSSGSGLCFRPNDNIRRGELSKVVRRAVESN